MKRSRRIGAILIGAVALGAFWLTLAPRQIGGPASYVITQGNSMEPRIHENDLVIVRESSYETGDVIAFYSPSLERIVMHRIERVDGDAFVTKGDNNDWLDRDRPTASSTLGSEWVHIPKAGRVLLWLSRPLHAAALVGIAAAVLLGKRFRKKDKKEGTRSRRAVRPPASPVGNAARWIAAGSVLVFGALSAFSFLQPEERESGGNVSYEHTGVFSYSAEAGRNVVYPDGTVATGDPLYVNLLKDLEMGFDYELVSEADRTGEGAASLVAELMSSSGWSKTFRLQGRTEFVDGARLEGTLDIEKMQRLITRIGAMTGVPDTYTLIVRPEVTFEGMVAGRTVKDRFAPELGMSVDASQLKVVQQDGDTDVFAAAEKGTVSVTTSRPNTISLPGIQLGVARARTIAVAGAGVSVLVLLGLLVPVLRRRRSAPDEAAAIAMRYRRWLVPVASRNTADLSSSVRVQSFDALVSLAEQYDRMILHERSSAGNTYFVEEDGTAYYYRIPTLPGSGRSGPPPPPPPAARRPVAKVQPLRGVPTTRIASSLEELSG